MNHARRKSSGAEMKAVGDKYNKEEDGEDDGFGDDFDDFEEGEDDAEFDDFDDGFQESQTAPPAQPVAPTPVFVSKPHQIQCISLRNSSPSLTSPNSTPQKKSIQQQNHT